MKKLCIFLVIGVLLTGCTALGLAPAQTTDQKIAYAYAGVTGVLNTIAQATDAGALTSVKAQQANQLAVQVKTTLDAARLASGAGDSSTALQDLNMATAALTAVQQYLTANGVQK
jgi:uncharacterized protein YceK